MDGKKTRPWWTKGVDISYRLHASFCEEGSLNPRLPRLALTCNPVDPGVWWRGPTRLSQVPGSQGYSSYMLGTLKIEVYL